MGSKIHNLGINKIHLTEHGLKQIIKLCNWEKAKTV
jgi:hypothetical protein